MSYRSIERISVAFRVSEMWLFRVDAISTDSIDAIIFHIFATSFSFLLVEICVSFLEQIFMEMSEEKYFPLS